MCSLARTTFSGEHNQEEQENAMTKVVLIESETYPISAPGFPKPTVLKLQARADRCREVAKQMVAEAKEEGDRGDVRTAEMSMALHNEELTRSAIYDVGAVLLEELQGITEILNKHTLGGLHLTRHPPTM